MASSPMSDSTKLRQEAGSELSTCMFSQYFGTFGMLFGVGVPVSIKARSYWPAATAALVGTMLDFAYGYNFACAEMVDNYRRAAELAPPRFGLAGVYGKEKEATEFPRPPQPPVPPVMQQQPPPAADPKGKQ